MSVQAISRFFGLGIDNWQPTEVELPKNREIVIDGSRRDEESIIAEAVLSTYDIENDDEALRENPEQFEKLRGDYPIRREFPVYRVLASNINPTVLEKLKAIGFQVEESKK
jgi:erythronate-4-phosphate dehydrogenase